MERSETDRQPAANTSKAAWRLWARQRRAHLDPLETGQRIAELLQSWPGYRGALGVLTYLAFGGEPDLRPLLTDSGKTFFTTRTADAGPLLTLHRLDVEDLERHRFGFQQPPAGATPASPEDIDLVLVPGLAFDLEGNRLGFGMGYYDRLLASLPNDVAKVGITSASLLVDGLPKEAHDVRMTHLATEDGVVAVADRKLR